MLAATCVPFGYVFGCMVRVPGVLLVWFQAVGLLCLGSRDAFYWWWFRWWFCFPMGALLIRVCGLVRHSACGVASSVFG